MERATIRMPKQQLDLVDEMVESGEYPNRSEAIRAAVRELIDDHRDRRGKLPMRATR